MPGIDNAAVRERLERAFPGAIQRIEEAHGELRIAVGPGVLIDLMRFLRDDPELRFNFLENLCGVDYLGRTPRFEVVYHLLSHANRRRLCVKVGIPESRPVAPSLTPLWSTANYQEREAFDMFGIIFDGHPSLDRILMPDDWQGHPQRKDVPLGAEEVAFTFSEERIYAQKSFARE